MSKNIADNREVLKKGTEKGTDIREVIIKARKTVKDSVFRDLFENPKYLFQLYQALHPEDKETREADISSVTIKNVLLDQLYNDLGFCVGSRLLVLVEAQSSWSVNIVVRALMYLANTWQEYIEERKLNVYGSRRIELPRPELYVIYTGEGEKPEWITLSEEFFGGQAGFVDVRVKVICDGEQGDIINQYVSFTKVYNEQVRKYGRTREAVLETIRLCKDRKVLAEYLQGREKEVVDIMMTLFSQEYALERYGDEREAEGRTEGRTEGKAEGKKEMALSLAGLGVPVEKIAEAAQVSVKLIQQWIAEDVSLAR